MNFLHGSQGIAQNIEERKIFEFFITIAIEIPAVQFLTQNINKELQKRLCNTVEYLRWNLFAKEFQALNMLLNRFLMTKL